MLQLKKHYHEIIKMDEATPPWPRMFLCAIATGLPLIIASFRGEISLAIYGALIGYLLALNDHLGETRHRVWVTVLTFVLLMGGFVAGFFLRSHPALFQFILAALVYWIGILGGDGAELERGVLFSVIGIVLVYFSAEIPAELIPVILNYCLFAFATMLIGIPLISIVKKRVPDQFAKLRASFHLSLTKQREKHVHAACYTAMTLLSVAVAHALHVERGYWITVTVLLVMRAERTQSIYKTLQRLFGTAFGVLLCDILGQFISSTPVVLGIIIICGFILPWALKRNYLYASFVMTVLIVFLLELSSSKFGDLTVPFLRLQATLIGCILSILGTALSKIISYVPKRS